MNKLTPRAAQVYEFILSFKKEHDGNSPTIRDIGKALEINSTSLIWDYLNKLANAGLIEFVHRENRSRMIVVVGAHWQKPLIGRAAKARKSFAGVRQ